MNILELNKVFEFPLPVSSSIDLVRLKYNKLLNLFEYSTGNESDSIVFCFKKYDAFKSRYKALEVFREGSILINPEMGKLVIQWSVKLDNLYFLSCLLMIVLPIIASSFWKISILNLIIIGTCSFGLCSGIGYLHILNRIDEINSTCLDE
jgi:hypothetical protein